MIMNKDTDKYHALGGVDGLISKLDSDREKGIKTSSLEAREEHFGVFSPIPGGPASVPRVSRSPGVPLLRMSPSYGDGEPNLIKGKGRL